MGASLNARAEEVKGLAVTEDEDPAVAEDLASRNL